MSCGFTFASRRCTLTHTLFGVSCRDNFFYYFLSKSKCRCVFVVFFLGLRTSGDLVLVVLTSLYKRIQKAQIRDIIIYYVWFIHICSRFLGVLRQIQADVVVFLDYLTILELVLWRFLVLCPAVDLVDVCSKVVLVMVWSCTTRWVSWVRAVQ